MKKITQNLIEQINNINEPFNNEQSIYLYLTDKKLIDFSYDYYKKIMSIYNYKSKKVYKNKNKQEVLNYKISKMEQEFCEAVYHLKSRGIYSVYKALYEQSLENPDVALKFLKLYDRKEKKYDEMIKSKHASKTRKDDNAINSKNIIEKNIKEINFLIQNPQEPNKINITDNTENNIK